MKPGALFDLTAAPVSKQLAGSALKMFAYNGSIPGPLLRVQQGSTLTVRFTNRLELDSSVHWHGVRVENASDGVPGVTQDPVRPGQSFNYRLRFPTPSLIPGRYRLRVRALTRHKSYTHLLDEVNAVWPFEIYDSGSLLSRMNIPWSGKVILPVEWDTVEHEEVGSP